ncbi:TPA: DUF551 domain-containing protein [Serratia fonticola]
MTTSTKRLTTAELRQIIDSHEKGHAMIVPINCDYLAAKELLAVREATSVPVVVPDSISYLKGPIISNILADNDNSPMACAARILVREVNFWRSQPLFTAPPALSGWITCSERMPTDETTVLVSNEEGVVWIADVDHGGQFYPDEFPVAKMSAGEITHWMPLPAAPTSTK